MRRLIGWIREALETAEVLLLLGLLQLGEICCGGGGDEFDP